VGSKLKIPLSPHSNYEKRLPRKERPRAPGFFCYFLAVHKSERINYRKMD